MVSNGPSASAPREPAPIPTGTLDYYQRRHDDFKARNPGATPPDYYLDYGAKYLKAFSALDHADLSPQGIAWRDAARAGLQRAIENLRAKDPAKFAELERDPDAFRKFAFESHPKAYLDAGLLDLPAQDLKTILFTPDSKDLQSDDGLRQVLEIALAFRRKGVDGVVDSSIDELLRKYSRASDDLTETVSELPDRATKAVERARRARRGPALPHRRLTSTSRAIR